MYIIHFITLEKLAFKVQTSLVSLVTRIILLSFWKNLKFCKPGILIMSIPSQYAYKTGAL